MSGDSSLGIGIGLALKSYGRAFRGLLNQYPGAAAAYSLRKLSGAVSNVVRVRRASDNDEKDFSAAQIESGEMVNWVNSQTVTVDGFVATWYDQSGNGNDATQATIASQPKIVDAGTLVTGGLDFDGTDDYFDTTHVIGATSTTFAVCESNFPSDLLLDMRDGGGDGLFMFSEATDTFRLQYNASSLTGSSGASGEKLASFLAKDGLQKIHINGTEVGSDIIAGTISVTNTTKIGARNFSDPISSVWDGTIQEIVIYHSDQSANRTAIEGNINAHYDIYA